MATIKELLQVRCLNCRHSSLRDNDEMARMGFCRSSVSVSAHKFVRHSEAAIKEREEWNSKRKK